MARPPSQVSEYARPGDGMNDSPVGGETLAYIAGAMDSDGWFTIHKMNTRQTKRRGYNRPFYSVRIGLKQTQPEIVTLLHECFGGSILNHPPGSPRGKPLLAWSIGDCMAEHAIVAMMPFLRVKKKQAQILLSLRSLKTSKRMGVRVIHQKCRWGRAVAFRQPIYSDEQMAAQEALYIELRLLNDTRWAPRFWPDGHAPALPIPRKETS